MYKLLATTILALLAICTSQACKTEVWNHPAIEFGSHNGDGFFNISLDVTKVVLTDTKTLVHMTIRKRPENYDSSWFNEKIYLEADGKRYAALSVEGTEFGKAIQTDSHARLNVTFHFPPLPQGTRSIDFIEDGSENAFRIKGIKPVEERWKQLLPSYWRDDKTGDWAIAFFEDCAVYQCKFWNYKQCDVDTRTGQAEMVICNGDDELKVSVGKDKKGRRTIQIGPHKATYSMMTSRFMPAYPVKDTRTGFVDTGYKTDTVTVVGWLKDMPERYRHDKTFQLTHKDFFTDKQQTTYADLDPQGRFTAKIPVTNSTEFFCDWSRCFVRTMFEPGKTYFMLYDFKEGRRYFMGDDARLQNELFKHPLSWQATVMERGDDFDRYIASTDSLIKAEHAYVDSLCTADPSLSTRFQTYSKNNTLCQQSFYFGQARFYSPDYRFPANARKYASETFWTRLPSPITLHRETSRFLIDYINDFKPRNSSFSLDIRKYLAECASNAEELALLTRWSALADELEAKMKAMPTMEEKQQAATEFNTEHADLIKEATQILRGEKAHKLIDTKHLIAQMKGHAHLLDSLKAAPIVKDISLSQLISNSIENDCRSLSQEVIDTLRALLSNPAVMETVQQLNNRYLALENREFDKVVLKSSDHLQHITEGEALLQKILQQFKGKIVLLDVWGTWCGPCKEALKHSTEEYARLSKYDIAYVYLANNSPRDSWENVIKMYNVSGENVAHYNLPQEQQEAIERFLNVQHYPTYKLFDREGNLLDIEVDAREIDKLERLIMQLQRE